MIEHDAQFKLMAYLDGELSERESAEVRAWLARDEEARALLTELQSTGAALAGHEAGLKLPESREFFWSKIQREIERQETAPVAARNVSWFAWLQSHFVPVGGVALLTCLLALLMASPGKPGNMLAEIDLASDDVGAYTYRDQQQKLTMIWFYDRGDDSQFTKEPSIASIEPE